MKKETRTAPARKKRWPRIAAICLAVLAVMAVALAVFIGWQHFFGPLKNLSVTRIQRAYSDRSPGGTVFYGASNFTFWTDMEEDLQPFRVYNHGFGGSTDVDLIDYADRLLYPYEPAVVVFQSGSNDFYLSGKTREQVIANKDVMFSQFRDALPDTAFVVMSMLPLPGRPYYWDDSVIINEYLREYCENHENMLFVDATDVMLTPDGDFIPEYFSDTLHLNREGQAVWSVLILEALAAVGAERY